MKILLNLLFFLLGFFIRKIFSFLYYIYRKIKKANEILAEENKRKEFKNKYDFSDCFEDKKDKNT